MQRHVRWNEVISCECNGNAQLALFFDNAYGKANDADEDQGCSPEEPKPDCAPPPPSNSLEFLLPCALVPPNWSTVCPMCTTLWIWLLCWKFVIERSEEYGLVILRTLTYGPHISWWVIYTLLLHLSGRTGNMNDLLQLVEKQPDYMPTITRMTLVSWSGD